MRLLILIGLLFLSKVLSSHAADTLSIAPGLNLELFEGLVKYKVNPSPLIDGGEYGEFSMWPGQKYEKLTIKRTSDNVRFSGGMTSPKGILYTFQTDIKREKENTLLVHSDITYVMAQKHLLHWNFIFPLEWKNSIGKYDKIKEGGQCEITDSSGFKKSYPIYHNDVPSMSDVKKVVIKSGVLITTIEPGKNSKIRFYDPRAGGDDRQYLYVILSSKPTISEDAKAGEKESFEAFITIVKNNDDTASSTSNSSADSKSTVEFQNKIVNIDRERKTITIRNDSTQEESTFSVNDNTKYYLNKSNVALLHLQTGMKVYISSGDEPNLAKTIYATTN
jgi:hypothetical protein